MSLWCRLFGHDYKHGHIWYPWGIASWWAYDKPTRRCGAVREDQEVQ